MAQITNRRVAAVFGVLGLVLGIRSAPAGQDHHLQYTSKLDGTQQPYRLYVPDGYRPAEPIPLIVALHGTTGDQGTFFDNPHYQKKSIKAAAERHRVLVVCPYGYGAREYRGMGEYDVFAVIEEVKKHWNVDPDRIYLTGHSMGGTGAAYLAMHHPDVFAAVAPLAAAYGFPEFAENVGDVPFWWIGAGDDRPYFLAGSGRGIARMKELGAAVTSEIIPNAGHYGPVEDLNSVVEWLVRHRRKPFRERFVFVVDTPLHGKAHWVRVDEIEQPGRMATITCRFDSGRIEVSTGNVRTFSILPHPGLLSNKEGVRVVVNGQAQPEALLEPSTEIACRYTAGRWQSRLAPLRITRLTDVRVTPVGSAPAPVSMAGIEAPLANWIADAMRIAANADIAIMNRQFYRGISIPAGQVDMIDLLSAMSFQDWSLIVTELSGGDILEILDDNVPDPKKNQPYSRDGPEASRLMQISGARYRFNPNLRAGHRITWSDIDPERRYTVALEGQVEFWPTVLLAGRLGRLRYRNTGIPLSSALYGHAMRQKVIQARVEGRVRLDASRDAIE